MMKYLMIILLGVIFGYFIFNDQANKNTSTFNVAKAFANGKCRQEAVLTLDELKVISHIGGSEVALIKKKSPIYLCEKKDNYQRIIYLNKGGSVDCSSRKNQPCPTGLVILPFKTIILG